MSSSYRPAGLRTRLRHGHSAVLAGILDGLAVVVFAAIGRASHAEGDAPLGVLGVTWPFLVGTAAGWALVRWRSGRWPAALGPGVVVVAATVAVGMVLRALTGQGTAPSFVVVATVALAVLMLGWRGLVAWLRSRR